ncbi:MAG: TolC family protein [Thermodesulfobacteriota bacterium]
MQHPKPFILFCLIVTLNTGITALAQNQPMSIFDLQQCIDKAVKNNPRILSSEEKKQQAGHEKKKAAANFYPEINLDYSYTYKDKISSFSSSAGTGEVTMGQHNNWAMEIYLEQPLFTGFEIINNYNLSKIGLKTAKAETELSRLEIIFQTTKSYYELLKAIKYREVADNAVVQLNSHLASAQKFYDHGVIPLNDLLEAKVNLANAKQDARTAMSRVRLARYQLATLMDQPLDFKFGIKNQARETIFKTKLTNLLKKAFKKRPVLKKANYNLKSAGQKVDLARSDYYPTLSLRAGHSRYGTDPLVNGQGLSDFSEPEDNTITIAAVWQLWDSRETAEEVNKAESGVREARHLLNEISDQVSLEVKNNFEQAYTAYTNIKPARLAVSQAEENLRMTRRRYQEQLSTNTDVLDARRLLTQTKYKFYKALYDYNILLAALARSTGGTIKNYELKITDQKSEITN